MTIRALTGVRYRDAILRIVVTPLISGLTLAFLMRDHAPVLAATVAIITIAQTQWASHWIGWLRHPTVVIPAIGRKPKMTSKPKTNTGSHTRLAVVSSTLMIGLLVGTGCPPGDAKPPKTPAEEKAQEDPAKREDAPATTSTGDAEAEKE
ncbi:MAG: hypothetical protein KC931_10060 [Candidatus Omnitrophica bacterium]|nr:hypothetical protein [Candidatus Omnitrophota bacterium]